MPDDTAQPVTAVSPVTDRPTPEPAPSPLDPVAIGAYTRSAVFGGLAAAVARAQAKFATIEKHKTAIVKTRTGGEFTYDYADLSDVLNEVRPKLAAEGVAIFQPVRTVQGGVEVTTLLVHGVSEQWFSVPMTFPVGDSRDPQSLGSAMAYARRYAIQSLVAVAPKDEDDDGERARERAKPPASQRSARREDPAPTPEERTTTAAAADPDDTRTITKPQAKRLVDFLKAHRTTEQRRMFAQYLKETYRVNSYENILRRDYDAIFALAQTEIQVPAAGAEPQTELS